MCRILSLLYIVLTFPLAVVAYEIPLLPEPEKDPICLQYAVDQQQEEVKKQDEKYLATYQSILNACRKPWHERTVGRMKALGAASASTVLFKFSQSEEEQRKRRIQEIVKEMENRNGGKLDPSVHERLGVEKLTWYEKIPALPLSERIHNWGLSQTTADILNFEGLENALQECYPNSLYMRMTFRHSLVYDDASPQALGIVVGGATMFFGGGWAIKGIGKLFSWVPQGLRRVGLTDKSIRYMKYSALSLGIGGSLYSWRVLHEAEMEKVQDTESILREFNSGVRELTAQINGYRQQCVTDIEQALTHKDNPGMYNFFMELAKLPCDYYAQTATAAITEMIERPVYRCDVERDRSLKEIIVDLEQYESIYLPYLVK